MRFIPSSRVIARQRGFLNPNIAKFLALSFLGLVIVGALIIGYALIFINPRLPSLDVITDYRPKIPLRIYSADNVLLGEFGEAQSGEARGYSGQHEKCSAGD